MFTAEDAEKSFTVKPSATNETLLQLCQDSLHHTDSLSLITTAK